MRQSTKETIDYLSRLIKRCELKGEQPLANIYRALATELVAHEFWRTKKREREQLKVAYK